MKNNWLRNFLLMASLVLVNGYSRGVFGQEQTENSARLRKVDPKDATTWAPELLMKAIGKSHVGKLVTEEKVEVEVHLLVQPDPKLSGRFLALLVEGNNPTFGKIRINRVALFRMDATNKERTSYLLKRITLDLLGNFVLDSGIDNYTLRVREFNEKKQLKLSLNPIGNTNTNARPFFYRTMSFNDDCDSPVFNWVGFEHGIFEEYWHGNDGTIDLSPFSQSTHQAPATLQIYSQEEELSCGKNSMKGVHGEFLFEQPYPQVFSIRQGTDADVGVDTDSRALRLGFFIKSNSDYLHLVVVDFSQHNQSNSLWVSYKR
jgi:hypothetical protein